MGGDEQTRVVIIAGDLVDHEIGIYRDSPDYHDIGR